ncbi:trypsin-like peptidase domain-containing protein [Brevundimonas sp.]|uniref:trypsin-like peptidase domain-containing protein n=1 Tax=Brevundimonas sp. TaxID=1871086 RepID=UPI002FC76DFC
MMKRKEFMLGAVAGLAFAAAATAGGVIDWPTAEAGPVAGVSGRLAPSAGGAGLAFAPPQGAPLSFADIFQQVAPAVVQIDVKTRIARQPGMIQIPGMPFAIPNPNGGGAPEGEDGAEGEGGATAVGAGSGFFIAANGYIVTNNHVVADATEIMVKLADGRELEARLVGRDESTDLAVIKVEGTDFPFVNFEETAQPRVGDWVIAVGNPFGLGGTATAGIVSASGRGDIDSSTPYTDYLQIDAAINRGNSGGPTFDIYGRVIGVNSAIYSPTGGSVGIGFAIPATVAKPITDQLMRGESVERGYVGVTIAPISADIAEALGLPDPRGALVVDWTPDAPAQRAGLRFGDVVTEIDGKPVATSTELTRHIATVRPGTRARLTVFRDGRVSAVTLSPTRRPSQTELEAAQGKASFERTTLRGLRSLGESILGLSLADSSEALRQSGEVADRYRGPVVVAVAPSAASDAGVVPGMLILAVNSTPVSSVSEARSAVAAARRSGREKVLLLVGTARGPAPLVVELTAE